MKHESPPPTSEPVISPLDDLRFKALYQLTAPDVQNVGRAFYSLVTSSSVSRLRAIEDYLHIFHSLRELSDSCPSFKRVLVEVSNVLFWKSSFQANFMLCIGAVLSIMDMVTDMTMVATFLARGNTGFAASMVAMISTNIFFQLVMTLDQTRDLGLKVFLLEAFYTISFLAPGIHAYRVASGKEIVKGEKLGPQNVLIFSKCMELVFEAVPGLLFQIYVYITLPISGNFAIVSIATSAMTTAFSASQMFFDKDTDLNNRLRSPNFYGIFPDEAGTDRSIAFLWLFIFSLAHVLAKGLGMALFWATFGGRTLFYYYGAEWGALLVVKALRKELVPCKYTEGYCFTDFRNIPTYPFLSFPFNRAYRDPSHVVRQEPIFHSLFASCHEDSHRLHWFPTNAPPVGSWWLVLHLVSYLGSSVHCRLRRLVPALLRRRR
jgi:hypothetical protein